MKEEMNLSHVHHTEHNNIYSSSTHGICRRAVLYNATKCANISGLILRERIQSCSKTCTSLKQMILMDTFQKGSRYTDDYYNKLSVALLTGFNVAF